MKLHGRLAALTFATAAGVYIALMSMGAVASPQDDTYSSTQTTMRGVFLTLSKAYKYSLDAETFESPANRNEIHNTLEGPGRQRRRSGEPRHRTGPEFSIISSARFRVMPTRRWGGSRRGSTWGRAGRSTRLPRTA